MQMMIGDELVEHRLYLCLLWLIWILQVHDHRRRAESGIDIRHSRVSEQLLSMVVELHVLYISLTATSKEHPDDKDLQASHADHHGALQQAEVEHSLFCAPHRAEVPVFTCAEVFLLTGEGGDLAGHAEDGLFHAAELLGRCAGFLGEVCAGLVFDLWMYMVNKASSDRVSNVCLTEISKSTSLSVKVETELSKQKRYSPEYVAVKT
jgi:hypothetical protein